MSVLIIFGHWLDFYQMVFAEHCSRIMLNLNLFDFGIAAGFVGIDHVGNRKGTWQISAGSEESSIPERKYYSSYIIEL